MKSHSKGALGALFCLLLLNGGVAQGQITPQIVGGNQATPGEYPYQARISWPGSPAPIGQHWCGGSLLTRSWVLTAGHCVHQRLGAGAPRIPDNQITITLGDHRLDASDGMEQVRSVATNGVKLHPGYVQGSYRNDVALIQLSSPVTLNSRVQTIEMALGDYNDGTTATLTGWGRTATQEVSPVLLEAALPLVSNEICAQSANPDVTASMLCAGTIPGPSGCGGDSGGPLVVTNGSGVRELVGVDSWAPFLCSSYTGFSRARDFKPWVDSIIATRPPVCAGRSAPGDTEWIQDPAGANTIYADIDTSACGWTSTPLYFSSLGGNSSHYDIDGGTAIYSPTATGFRVYLNKSGLTPDWAQGKDIHINWQSIANNTNILGLCSGKSPNNTWFQDGTDTIYMDVNTSACGLFITPSYFTSHGGNSSHFTARGATSIYSPTATGFRVYINKSGATPAYAQARNWHINWRAEASVASFEELCNGFTAPGLTPWVQDTTNRIVLDVNTSLCAIGTTPKFYPVLNGLSSHFTARTVTSIYSPTPGNFRIYLQKNGITPAQANQLGWYVTWNALP